MTTLMIHSATQKDEAPLRLQSCKAGCNCFSPRSAVDHAERSVRQKGSLEIGDLGKHGEWTANEFQCTHAEFKYLTRTSKHFQRKVRGTVIMVGLRLTATQTHRKTSEICGNDMNDVCDVCPYRWPRPCPCPSPRAVNM